jgi:hypothetical protein
MKMRADSLLPEKYTLVNNFTKIRELYISLSSSPLQRARTLAI